MENIFKVRCSDWSVLVKGNGYEDAFRRGVRLALLKKYPIGVCVSCERFGMEESEMFMLGSHILNQL